MNKSLNKALPSAGATKRPYNKRSMQCRLVYNFVILLAFFLAFIWNRFLFLFNTILKLCILIVKILDYILKKYKIFGCVSDFKLTFVYFSESSSSSDSGDEPMMLRKCRTVSFNYIYSAFTLKSHFFNFGEGFFLEVCGTLPEIVINLPRTY